MQQKYKKIVVILSIIIALILLGYWFFAKTVRGNSWALYLAGGWHAPFAVKWECAKQTDKDVEAKFSRPLKFDEASKNLLKNFWYYSYFRSCLYKHGYDFSGYPIPESLIAINIYENKLAGISFNIPEQSLISLDNSLDVDVDDRLFVTEIKTPAGLLHMQYYSKHDVFTSNEELNSKMQSIPMTGGMITQKKIVELASGAGAIEFRQTDGNIGLALVSPDGKVYIIYGEENLQAELENIKLSLNLF